MGNGFKKLINHSKKIKFLLSRFLWFTRLSNFIVINRQSYKMRFFPSSVSAKMFENPKMSLEESYLSSILESGDIVVDVGANVGTYSLLFSYKVGIKGKVFSFEANPRTFKFLKKNINLNDFINISAKNLAIGETEKIIGITNKRADDMNYLVKDSTKNIKMTTLDQILESVHDKIKLLKIDVEGYELQVLKGSGRIINQVEYLFIEISKKNYFRYDNQVVNVIDILKQNGFSIYKIEPSGLKEIKYDSDVFMKHTMNVIAKKNGNPIE